MSSDAGRQFPTGPQGYSQFNMTLGTAANDGVLLRRRMAYNTPAQTAAVYVDNQPAGTWYDAGGRIRRWSVASRSSWSPHRSRRARLAFSFES